MTEQDSTSRRDRRRAAATDGEDPEIKDRNKRLVAEANQKRAQRSAERTEAVEEGLGAAEIVDNALTRSADATGKFVRTNFAWLQWIVIGGIVAAVGTLIYDYRVKRTEEKDGDRLAQALAASVGRVATADAERASDPNLVDTRPEYSTEEARDQGALKAWETLGTSSDTEMALLAKMGRAGVLYDTGKFAEAKTLYSAVVDAAKKYPELQAHALENLGLCQEAEKAYDAALATFDKLAAVGPKEMKDLARFHKARVTFLKGDKEGATKVLLDLRADLKKAETPSANPMDMFSGPKTYLGRAVEELLKSVDPKAVPKDDLSAQMEAIKKLMAAQPAQPSAPAPAPEAPQGQGPSAPESESP